ncbi:MAG: DsbA family protein [Chromatiales bacterium]|jgi:putative protein-disulfide isomerase
MNARLYYVHDPMCSWCWGFGKTRERLLQRLPPSIEIVRLLGGLAPDSNEPMSDEMREYLQQTWRRIEQRVPGTSFNFDFWQVCEPRRSTWPACRAVIAARRQGATYDEVMTHAIQEAYYRRAMNPADEAVLVTLAGETGLDQASFQKELRSPAVQEQLQAEMQRGRAMGATSFPSLILELDGGFRPVPVNYTDEEVMLEAIRVLTEE